MGAGSDVLFECPGITWYALFTSRTENLSYPIYTIVHIIIMRFQI